MLEEVLYSDTDYIRMYIFNAVSEGIVNVLAVICGTSLELLLEFTGQSYFLNTPNTLPAHYCHLHPARCT